MIALSVNTFDLKAHLIVRLSNGTQFPVLERRASRTATLDGFNTINDNGLSETDGQFLIETVDISAKDTLEYLIKSYPIVNLSSRVGFFTGVIKRLDTQSTPIQFLFLANKKLG